MRQVEPLQKRLSNLMLGIAFLLSQDPVNAGEFRKLGVLYPFIDNIDCAMPPAERV